MATKKTPMSSVVAVVPVPEMLKIVAEAKRLANQSMTM